MAELSKGVYACQNVGEIIKYIMAVTRQRARVVFGVQKEDGKSYDRLRREANSKAIDLLNSLPDGAMLTDEQRQILAGYTGEGGIGGSVSEYYTPQPIAEGVWEMMKLYGADVGNTLEPSAGTGIFNETKPLGTLMTATEISDISGRINQLLHPEDKVSISPFEALAFTTPDSTFDHVVGNVPFGGRDNSRNIDKPYAEEKDMGAYFMLRMLDKIKPGGFMCVIVPPGIVSGSNQKRLRDRLSRKAEFLGAHRLPTGTFDANGTDTVVDVVLMRKHPQSAADKISDLSDDVLTEASVLWPEFINGKWFEQDGRRFVHGEQTQGFQGRIQVKSDGQIDNVALKQKLIHKFDSRINWLLLDVEQPSDVANLVEEGELRIINGNWFKMTAGKWEMQKDAGREIAVSVEQYGADTWDGIRRNIETNQGRLAMSFAQMSNVRASFSSELSNDMVELVDWIGSQPEKFRDRLYRGAIIGRMMTEYHDLKAGLASAEQIEAQRLILADRVQAEIDRYGNPARGAISRLSGKGSKSWFAFRGAIKSDGTVSDELSGNLVKFDSSASYDATSYQDTLRHLYSDLTQDPVQLQAFREAFKGKLPDNDDDLLSLLANTPGIAISPYGGIVPFARATSGDIGEITAPKYDYLHKLEDGPVKNNILSQLAAIEEKRIITPGDSIRFKLNSRWFDRSVILEFLQEHGYSDLKYVRDIQIYGDSMISETYNGGDGIFVGHRYGIVQRKDKESGETIYEWDRKSGDNATGFPAQLEKYLNGARIGGKDAATANGYRDKVDRLEEQFNKWIKTHDSYDELVGTYNNVFNSNIPYEHSGAPLGLQGVSGLRDAFDYQNQEVRRLSEDGRGILGFGTGLGKTMTALALEAFNFESGRSVRTAYVVPKSVLENWYYEAKGFLSADAFSNYLFVGLDVMMDGDNILQVPVLNENGQPEMNSDGTPKMRDGLRVSDEATVTARMNSIPHSNYRAVVFTKEQYARIPLRDDTVDEHAQDILMDFVSAGKVASAADSDSHRKEAARRRILADGSDTGTEKAEKYPYFEDMGFDSVIADEGHNYRNSYKNGREASQLAYLPGSAVAQSARDMAIKNAYLMKQNGGRGPVLLTATPVVNTPIDAYNMLSHVLPKEFWQKLGVFGPDDFVKLFGKTRLETIQKLSGEVEEKMALVGFENLDALRGIFHRWTTLKTAEDVKDTVEIPELDEHQQDAPLSAEQMEAYEDLRLQAEALSNDGRAMNGEGEIEEIGRRPIFSIIRDMDRVCTDMDLYHRRITFRFPPEYNEAVKKLVDSLPKTVSSEGDDDESETASVEYSLIDKGDFIQLQVREAYEDEVNKRLAKFGIDESRVTHPITPKYEKLIATLKEYYPEGKQIIFTDEKTQHNKLKRIIANSLGIDASKIGILNAQTVAEAGKGGKKVKAVKPPKELPDEPTEAQLQKYLDQMALYDDYIAQKNEVSLGGLEKIAADFQEGRTPIIICNKKAEVGINLHKGTTDIHHLTLPWTPASIAQRNGRGARVGSGRARVRVHYYCGKGSFDEYRLKTLKRKSSWITDILRSDKSSMENADANDMIEMQMYTAKDDGSRLAMMQTQMDAAKAAQLARRQEQASIDLQNYIKAQHASGVDVAALAQELEKDHAELEKTNESVERNRKNVQDKQESNDDWKRKFGSVYSSDRALLVQYRGQLKGAIDRKQTLGRSIKVKEAIIARAKKSESEIKRLRPQVEDAINTGLLSVDMDIVSHASEYYFDGNKAWKVGCYYVYNSSIVRLTSINLDDKRGSFEVVYSPKGMKDGSTLLALMAEQTDYTPDELTLLGKINGGVSIVNVADILSRDQFYDFLNRGLISITDSYVFMAGENGGYEASGIYGDSYLKRVIYPDVNDGALKSAVAGWILELLGRGKSYAIKGGETFFAALYGKDYMSVVYSYAEALSTEALQDRISAALANRPEKHKLASVDGNSESEVLNAIYSTTAFNDYDFLLRASMLGETAQYSNQGAIKQALEDANFRIKADRGANLKHAVMSLTQSWVSAIKSSVAAGGLSPLIRDVVNDGRKMMETYATGESIEVSGLYGGTKNVSTLNFVSMFSDLVLAGLVDITAVTPEMLGARNSYVSVLVGVAEILAARSDEQKASDRARIDAALGIEPEAVNDEPPAILPDVTSDIATAQGSAIEEAAALGLNFRISTTDLKMMYAPRFNAGAVFGLQQASGEKGALFLAKDELKASFGARWLPAKAKNSDFPGNWWIIETSHNPMDVLALVKKHM